MIIKEVEESQKYQLRLPEGKLIDYWIRRIKRLCEKDESNVSQERLGTIFEYMRFGNVCYLSMQ